MRFFNREVAQFWGREGLCGDPGRVYRIRVCQPSSSFLSSPLLRNIQISATWNLFGGLVASSQIKEAKAQLVAAAA